MSASAPDADYRFKHALIQDAAYEKLLKSRRQQFHRRIAQTLVFTIAIGCRSQHSVAPFGASLELLRRNQYSVFRPNNSHFERAR
jgi:hypothetical protein